ncbi:hypothetical protein V8E54_009398 [Elaphomyces granulatus]
MNPDLHVSMAHRESESHSQNSQSELPDNFEPVRLRTVSTQHNRNDEPETVELDDLEGDHHMHYSPSSASLSSSEYRVTPSLISRSSRQSTAMDDKGLFGPFRRFWLNHVAVVVQEKGNRDHFGTWKLTS